MPRWPFRQIDSINKTMEDLHDQLDGARTEADRARYDTKKSLALMVYYEYVRGDSPRGFSVLRVLTTCMWGSLFFFLGWSKV